MERILIVDDEYAIRTLLAETLKEVFHKECEIHFAIDGWDALGKAMYHTIDLLITDNQMPTMSGAELIRKFRGYFPTIPILGITGADPLLLQVAGATLVLQKPMNINCFIHSIQKLLPIKNRNNYI